MKILSIALLAAVVAGPAYANDAHHPAHAKAAPAATSDTVPAEVRGIDSAAGKVTLSHGPLKNLGGT